MKRSHVLILGTALLAGAVIFASLTLEAEPVEVAAVEKEFEPEAPPAADLAVREPTPDEEKREFVPAEPVEPKPMTAKEKIARRREARREARMSGPASVRVIVRNADNQAPLAGVVVELFELGTASTPSTSRTDSEGSLRFAVEHGRDYEVRTTIPGTANRFRERVVEDADGQFAPVFLEVSIFRTQLIRGQVIAAHDGGPIGGAEVMVFSTEQRLEPISLFAHSDGRFEVELPLFLEAAVSASAAGFARGGELVSGAELESEVLIELEQTAALDVRVVDIGGQPVSGMTVTVRGEQASNSISTVLAGGRLKHTGVTGSNGEVSFEGLPPGLVFDVKVVPELEEGRRSVLPKPLDFGPRGGVNLVSLEPGERRSLELFHGGGIRITGSIVDAEGVGIPDHPVGLYAAIGDSSFERIASLGSAKSKAISDGRGRFQFEDIQAGNWWLRASTGDANAEPVYVQTSADRSSTEITIVLHRGLFISGTVVDPTGRGVKADVFAFALGEYVQSKSDADGSFSLGPLRAGTYEIGTQDPHEFATAMVQEVTAGTSGVTIALREGGQLWIRVVDEGGVALNGVCWVSGGTGDERIWDLVKKDQLRGGEARFKQLIPGAPYSVFVRSEERVAMLGEVRTEASPPSKPLLLVAERGAILELTNPSATALRFGMLHSDQMSVGVFRLAPGQTERMAVPAGEITVEEFDLLDGEFATVGDWRVECEVGEVSELRLE